jgi:hypothetical protein
MTSKIAGNQVPIVDDPAAHTPTIVARGTDAEDRRPMVLLCHRRGCNQWRDLGYPKSP